VLAVQTTVDLASDPGAAGFDPARLERIDEHLRTRYVEPGKIAGCQVVVARGGTVAHAATLGDADRERQAPVRPDTIWRIFSMTKPITGVALLTLYEQGRIALKDPVSRYIPEFRDQKVRERLDDGTKRLVDARRPTTVRDVLMHTSGIGYGPRDARLDLASNPERAPSMRLPGGGTLQTLVERLGPEPLRFHPGTHWLYSWSTDVVARLVEVVSGRRFDHYVQETILDPLGMVDTGFSVPESSIDRFAALYRRNARKEVVLVDDPLASPYLTHPTFLSGGGGLVSTAADYLRFCQMLAGGGAVDGVRVLAPKTVELMRTNHLPGGVDLAAMAVPGGYGEVGFDGMGFGLTVAVSQGPAATQAAGSAGEFMWGGFASTAFWIDPVEDLVVVFMTQLLPSGTFDFRGQLKALVYGALVA
jgi:CubicO group peptidase (beta-lactamase class C family)